MSFPSYPKYKDSGVEWLGEVPEHWEVMPLKYVARFTSGGTPNKAVAEYWDGDVPWASSKDLKSETLSDTCDHITQAALDEGAAVLVPAGSVLVVVRGMILLHTFPVVQILVPMAINQDVKAVAPVDGVTAAYLPWLFRGSTTETFSRVDEAAHGTKVLRMESWTSIALPIPPHPEQSAIATFLERETAKIDALIAEQRWLIELLQEKRQAVISHAVTKGLNPDAPMKDSGIEWLGEVPEHWEIVRLRYLCDIQTGGRDTENAVEDGLYPFFVRSETVERINTCAANCEAVFTAGDGAGVGKVFHHYQGPFDFHQRVYMMNNFRQVTGRFLYHYLRANFYKVALEGTAKSTVDSLRRPMFTGFPVAVPPLREQGNLVAVVESDATDFDSLVTEAARAITLLQERRSALISAAVTGQIDVRGLAGSEAA